jgi:hypothetical protein
MEKLEACTGIKGSKFKSHETLYQLPSHPINRISELLLLKIAYLSHGQHVVGRMLSSIGQEHCINLIGNFVLEYGGLKT